MFRSALLCGGSALAVAASLYGSQVLAADASDTATAPSVGELVVVAEKREQSIESVPVAVTAFSAEQKELLGIQKVQDLSDFSPGLSWTDIDDRIYIRGIGRNSDNLNNTSGVAVYYNGVYYGANAAIELQRDTLFVGNTEVDNGPQNTLHGSNADGGVIQFTSQRPTDTPYTEVRVGAANYSEYFGEAVISGPINDHLKFRLGGNYTQMTGGYFDNLDGPPQGGNLVLGGGGQTHYIEGQLEGHWDKFDIWGLVSTGDFAANTHGTADLGNFPDTPFTAQDGLTPSDFYGLCGLPGVIGSANGAGCAGGPAIVHGSVKTLPYTANNYPGNNPANVNSRNFLEEFNGINDQQRNIQGTLNATWHADGFDVTYLAAYQQFHYILRIPNQYVGSMDAGVTQYQEEGPAALSTAAATCQAVVATPAECTEPLTINPTPNYLIFDEYDQSTSHEVDFSSTTNSPFQWVGGLYFYHEHWNQPVNQFTTPDQSQMGAPMYSSALGQSCPGGAFLCAAPANPSFAGSTENTEINYNSYAGFAQGSYKFNDQWKISGAFRYTEDTKSGWQEWRVVSFDNIFTAPSFGAATPALDITSLAVAGITGPYPGTGALSINKNTGFAQRTLNASWGAPTGEVDIDWTPDRSFLAYAKYSRGYKSGGWSTYTIIASPEVNPEYVDAFEVGAKKTLGSKLTVNADAFYYNYYGEQVPVNESTPTQSFVVLYNVPLVHNYGAELWGSYHPIDPLVFNLSYSYLSAKIVRSGCVEDVTDPLAVQPGAKTSGCKETNPIALEQNVVGEEIPGATPNKVSFNAIYTWNFEPGKLSLSGSVIWKDATYDAIFNRSYNLQPPYDQVNLLLNWASANNRYNVILFCDNLLNSTGYDGSAGAILNTVTAPGQKEDILTSPFLTAPRTFGIQVQYRWQ